MITDEEYEALCERFQEEYDYLYEWEDGEVSLNEEDDEEIQ